MYHNLIILSKLEYTRRHEVFNFSLHVLASEVQNVAPFNREQALYKIGTANWDTI